MTAVLWVAGSRECRVFVAWYWFRFVGDYSNPVRARKSNRKMRDRCTSVCCTYTGVAIDYWQLKLSPLALESLGCNAVPDLTILSSWQYPESKSNTPQAKRKLAPIRSHKTSLPIHRMAKYAEIAGGGSQTPQVP